MTIYEIDKEIMNLTDPETGEITDFDSLMALQMDRDRKIENLAIFYKNNMAEADAIKAEISSLEKRKKAAESRANSAKRYLEYILQSEPFKTAKCEISFRKSSRVEILSTQAVKDWFSDNRPDLLKTEIPGKKEIGDLIKSGAIIPSVAIVDSMNMGVK